MDFDNLANAITYAQTNNHKFIVQFFENFDVLLGKDFEVSPYSEDDSAKCYFFMNQEAAEDFQHNSIFSHIASVVRTTVIDVEQYLAYQAQPKAEQGPSLVLKPKHSQPQDGGFCEASGE